MKYEELYKKPSKEDKIKFRETKDESLKMANVYIIFALERNLFGDLSVYDVELVNYILGLHSDDFYSEGTLKRFKRDIEFIKQELL